MNRREDALVEALQSNAEEIERWKLYLKENETAKENLSMFQKHLNVEVMVPVGKKALMPGNLIHTNEVLVGHYQGYFSKCSAFKAAEICDLRINIAKEHLNQLENELQLWQNKLEKPYTAGIMPTGEEREIIEDYNEEQEKMWREQHNIRLKQAKQKEKQYREAGFGKEVNMSKPEDAEESDKDVLKMLEEAELMEELENELENLELEDMTNETIHKLITGEMKLPPEKKRIAHDNDLKESKENETQLTTQIVKKASLNNDQVYATNNNVVPNPEIYRESGGNNHSDEGENDDVLPEEVKIIREQAKFLCVEDQIGFYDYQMEIIRQKLISLSHGNQEQIDEKIRLFSVLEHLDELLEIAENDVGNNELLAQEKIEEDTDLKETENCFQKDEKNSEMEMPKKHNQKRRISFALEDETLEFCKTEAVTQMLPVKREKPKRDIITLGDEKYLNSSEIILTTPVNDKIHAIQDKVEQNRQFISETQSKQDFDLVNKILENLEGKVNTLHITFKHSSQMPENILSEDNKDLDIPASPGDFYLKYLVLSRPPEPSTLFVNSYEGEDQVKTPVLREVDKQQAFEDPKAVFSNPKSILRNKNEIEKENHLPNVNEKKQKKKKRTPKEEEESFSAYNKVMNDVVEKPLNEPEPLPEGKYIDAHAPKKRVSRFKQMRQGTEKT